MNAEKTNTSTKGHASTEPDFESMALAAGMPAAMVEAMGAMDLATRAQFLLTWRGVAAQEAANASVAGQLRRQESTEAPVAEEVRQVGEAYAAHAAATRTAKVRATASIVLSAVQEEPIASVELTIEGSVPADNPSPEAFRLTSASGWDFSAVDALLVEDCRRPYLGQLEDAKRLGDPALAAEVERRVGRDVKHRRWAEAQKPILRSIIRGPDTRLAALVARGAIKLAGPIEVGTEPLGTDVRELERRGGRDPR
jgi:hypothetical protein